MNELSSANKTDSISETHTKAADASKPGFREKLRTLFPFLGLALVLVLFSVLTKGSFLALSNIKIILLQSVILMIGGMGATFVMSHGNIDFALGGALKMSAVVGGFVAQSYPALAAPACILTAVLIYFVNGFIHIKLKVQSFIVALCLMFVGTGVIQQVVNVRGPINLPRALSALDNVYVYVIAAVVVFIAAYVVFEYTKIGKMNKAIGSNIVATTMSGINVNKYKMLAFLISGVTVGICAFLSMIRAGSVSSNIGSGFELNVFISMVVGGMPFTGGSNVKLRQVIIGTLILTFLSNGLVMVGVNADIVGVIKAVVFLGAVYVAQDRRSNQIAV